MNYCLMEVSSHAISQKKVSPIIYEAVAFTSFSRDHLDFHSSMKEYFDVKWGFVSQQINQGARAFVSEGSVNISTSMSRAKKILNLNHIVMRSMVSRDLNLRYEYRGYKSHYYGAALRVCF